MDQSKENFLNKYLPEPVAQLGFEVNALSYSPFQVMQMFSKSMKARATDLRDVDGNYKEFTFTIRKVNYLLKLEELQNAPTVWRIYKAKTN